MHSLSHFWVSIKLYSNRVNRSISSDSCLLLQVLFKWFISLLEILLFHFKPPVRVARTLSLYSSDRPRIAWWACTGSHFYKSVNFFWILKMILLQCKNRFSILNACNLRLISWFEIFTPSSNICWYLYKIMPLTQPLVCFLL